MSVICDGGLGYTFTEVLDFIRCVESDMNKSIIDLWEKVPPSLRATYTGNKETLLKQLGLL